jgi:hypothetical protein
MWWPWSNPLYAKAHAPIFRPIVDPGPDPQVVRPLVVDQDYVTVRLKSLRIVNVRKGVDRFYGCVHGFIALLDRRVGVAEFHTISTSEQLKRLDLSDTHRVADQDIPLLKNAPYRGDLHLELGLFSVQSSDLTEPYLNLLGSITKAAGVGLLQTALSFAAPLKTGIDLLVGAKAMELEVGVNTEPKNLATGTYLVMRAPSPQSNIKAEELQFTASGELKDGTGKMIDDHPYMVFTVEAAVVRNDWFLIPEIKIAHDKMMEALRANKPSEVTKDHLPYFRRVCLTCPDLLDNHSQAIVAEQEKKVKEILRPTRASQHQYPTWSLEDLDPFGVKSKA